MLRVHGLCLSGRGLEDLSPLEQIRFALFLIAPPTSESVFHKAQGLSIGIKLLELLKAKLKYTSYHK